MSTAMGPSVHVTDEGPVRTIAISNPEKKNALTRPLLADLVGALPVSPSGEDQPIRAVILTGDPAGGAFSSGYDINAIDASEREQGLDPIQGPADAIESCAVPVIAALNGHVFGGAFELAMACHIRVASSAVKLGMPPAKLGLVYSPAGLGRFLRATSPSVCNRLFLVGEPIDGDVALRLGLVDVKAGDGPVMSPLVVARELAEKISKNAPLAVTGLLDAIRRLSKRTPDDDDMEAIETARAATVGSDDLQEGVRAFIERRAPRFSGK